MSLINLLEEIIKAGKGAKIPLDMESWHCGTACCACGDVAALRNPDANKEDLSLWAEKFSADLDEKFTDVFGDQCLAESIYLATASGRRHQAIGSYELTTEELEHPHLTTDHNDREILHDYIRLVIGKVEGKIGE